ncbi:MAG: sigma-54 dependent transcriptional regulator [Proteobacteria bacterium]|nr:sigma-54 dependent transcriptional regulator [Pseudomonadota bacterium]
MANVLVIDDDQMICEMITDIVQDVGHSCDSAHSLRAGLAKALSGRFDVVFQDVYLSDGMGLDLLPQLKEAPGRPEVVIITGAGETHVAERAMREGAWDFVAKPLDLDGVLGPLERALKYRGERHGSAVKKAVRREGIAGSSPLIRALLSTVAMAGESGASVLITGETGTGKELFARAIHANSPRATKPFVVVDCASLPENLVESILFGHVKGAFTGAEKARDGLVMLANGGTLFLDEVGELPFAMQRSFLRVLEGHTFRPVGSKNELGSDFRLVAATNRHLDEMVERGEFRKDLLYRIRSFSIEVPPLRERVEDIEEIVSVHMARMTSQGRFQAKGFSPEFVHALASYPWPGNVRELVNCLERSLATAHADRTLFLTHLPENVRVSYARTLVNREGPSKPYPGTVDGADSASLPSRVEAAQGGDPSQPGSQESWSVYRERAVGHAEQDYFKRLLAFTHGNIRESCEIAGVSRARLYQILQKHDIKRLH